jgi:hypothetical protein
MERELNPLVAKEINRLNMKLTDAEYEKDKLFEENKRLKETLYWYYCNSSSCTGISQKKLLELDELMEQYENAKNP